MTKEKLLSSLQEIQSAYFNQNSKFNKDKAFHRIDASDRIEGIVYRVTQDQIVISFREMHDFVN